MWKNAKGGGGNKVMWDNTHTSNIAAGSTTTFNCGFRPKYIMATLQYLNGSSWFQMTVLHNNEVDPNRFTQFWDNNIENRALPNTTYLGIGEITDTYFTIVNPPLPIRYLYAIAVSY